jgi:sulfur-carrier protein
MNITVKLFATFRIGRFAELSRTYPPGTRIAAIIEELRLPVAQIGMILCNCRHVEPDLELQDMDTLSIFPLVGGG